LFVGLVMGGWFGRRGRSSGRNDAGVRERY
jgi:hypothetical protein